MSLETVDFEEQFSSQRLLSCPSCQHSAVRRGLGSPCFVDEDAEAA